MIISPALDFVLQLLLACGLIVGLVALWVTVRQGRQPGPECSSNDCFEHCDCAARPAEQPMSTLLAIDQQRRPTPPPSRIQRECAVPPLPPRVPSKTTAALRRLHERSRDRKE
jgi:hypothetical protein